MWSEVHSLRRPWLDADCCCRLSDVEEEIEVASEIRSWQIKDGKLVALEASLAEAGRRERDDLEEWIRTNPAILGEDMAVIGEQVQTASGPIDFLAVDTSGNTVIVELKRGLVPREAVVQAIDYASDVASWDIDRFREICTSFRKRDLDDFLEEEFEGVEIEDLGINQTQRLLLVGFSAEESLSRIVDWLSTRYSMSIMQRVFSPAVAAI